MSARPGSDAGDIPGASFAAATARTLHVEIDAGKLLELLRDRRLCATDLRCLDAGSGRCLRGLCLLACVARDD